MLSSLCLYYLIFHIHWFSVGSFLWKALSPDPFKWFTWLLLQNTNGRLRCYIFTAWDIQVEGNIIFGINVTCLEKNHYFMVLTFMLIVKVIAYPSSWLLNEFLGTLNHGFRNCIKCIQNRVGGFWQPHDSVLNFVSIGSSIWFKFRVFVLLTLFYRLEFYIFNSNYRTVF